MGAGVGCVGGELVTGFPAGGYPRRSKPSKATLFGNGDRFKAITERIGPAGFDFAGND